MEGDGQEGRSPRSPRRGSLRILLGAAPGVGKTYRALDEARRRAVRGTDVVVALVEHHDRPATRAMLADLEVLPRRTMTHRGTGLTEMDLDAVLARAPQVAVVDELAHTNAPGSRNAKRWQDVEEILDAGIDVVSTLNVQHLESLGEVVRQVTGVPQRETLPDEVARRAEQVELVDMTPQALRRRLAHGNVYPAERVDAALGHYFRPGNLAALRELALLWLADRVDEGLERYRSAHGIDATWAARERVLVALTGGPEGRRLVRHAARMAARGAGGELLAVHVPRSDGLTGADPGQVLELRRLVESLGGTWSTVVGEDVAAAVLAHARSVNAGRVVVGASRRGRLRALWSRGVGEQIIEGSGDIAVEVVPRDLAARTLRPVRRPRRAALRPARRATGWGLALVGPPVLALLLAGYAATVELDSELLALLALVVVVALVGGRWPAVVAALSASALANYLFTTPERSLRVASADDVVAIGLFVVVGVSVATVVDGAARQRQGAAAARDEAEVLASLAGDVLDGDPGPALPRLLARAREVFGADAASVLVRSDPGWAVVAADGDRPPTSPAAADASAAVDPEHVLALRGRALPAGDQRILRVVAAQAAGLVERDRLRRGAAVAEELAHGNQVRTALLAAVSHDLRTPLAGIKVAASTLRLVDVHLEASERDELLATVETSADRLGSLVANLLDLTRLQTGSVTSLARAVDVGAAVAAAVIAVGQDLPAGRGRSEPPSVDVDVAEDLPALHADPALLERVLVNLLQNALRYAGSARVTAGELVVDGRPHVGLRVVDRGPGLDPAGQARMFVPFQRLRDGGGGTGGEGVGLGLAVARGLSEAMGGTLTAEDTPGGGLTVVLELPASAGGGGER